MIEATPAILCSCLGSKDPSKPYTSIPLVTGIKNVLAYAAVPDEHKIKDPDHALKETLRGILPADKNTLPPNAVRSLIEQVMIQHNIAFSETKLDLIESNIKEQGACGEYLVNEVIHQSHLPNEEPVEIKEEIQRASNPSAEKEPVIRTAVRM